jgi:chemotaxis protein MotB
VAAKSKANSRPLLVKKVVEDGGHGHHGGAWKVAYADFVTAMMAFFLLLWLLSTSSEETLKGLAEYFSESITQAGPPGGVGGALQGVSVVPDTVPRLPASPIDLQPTVDIRKGEGSDGEALAQAAAAHEEIDEEAVERLVRERERAQFESAKRAIEQALSSAPEELRRLKESLIFDQTPEGLRIQIVDREQYAMFPLGSDEMYPHTRRLLEVVARAVRGLPNRISIRGHTDARPFAPRAGYDNWRLSSDRANATRLALVEAGLDPARIAEVVGRADSEPLFPADPNDPRNRRISLVLLHDRPPPAPGRTRRRSPGRGARVRALARAGGHGSWSSGTVEWPGCIGFRGVRPGPSRLRHRVRLPSDIDTTSRRRMPWPDLAAETLTLPSPVGPLRAGLARPRRGERGTVFLLEGRGEFLEKYAATVAQLVCAGFVVFGLDWRGQGGSPRLVPPTPRGHVDDFDHYLEDLDSLVARAGTLNLPRPWSLLGHSLGGHLALRWLGRGPAPMSRAALVTPMFGIALVPPPRRLFRVVAETAVRAGLGRHYAPGQHDPLPSCAFEGNPLTSCPEGFAALWELRRRHPERQVGGATWGWLAAALRSIEAVDREGVPEKIELPVLVVRAGDDRIVCNRAIERVARRLPRGRLVDLPGARHDLFFERSAVRVRLFDELVRFLAGEPEELSPAARREAASGGELGRRGGRALVAEP